MAVREFTYTGAVNETVNEEGKKETNIEIFTLKLDDTSNSPVHLSEALLSSILGRIEAMETPKTKKGDK